ncbi:unnamed protein product, partial [Urochloa humidicola]
QECDVSRVQLLKVAKFSTPDGRDCCHYIHFDYRPASLIEISGETIRPWSFIRRKRADCLPDFFFRERSFQVRKIVAWDGQFLQIDCYLSVHTLPQEIIIKFKDIFLLVFMASEYLSIFRGEFANEVLPLAVPSTQMKQ